MIFVMCFYNNFIFTTIKNLTMKKILLTTFFVISCMSFAQVAGDIYSVESKLDLTPEGVIQKITQNSDSSVSADMLSFLANNSIGIKAQKITYYTPNYQGKLVKATGLVLYPKVNFNLSTVLYCHPTTDQRNNVPSNLKDILGVGFVLPLSYALAGYIVVAPDYLGLGSGDEKHPYVNAKTEASACIDMMKAANKFLATQPVQRYNENFITGYSQGGHVAMSVIKANKEKYNNLYNFKYMYAGAGPYDMSDTTLNKGIIAKTTYPNSAFLAYVINSCNYIGYKQYTTSYTEIIAPEYQTTYQNQVINEGGGLFWGPQEWRKLFKDTFITAITTNSNHPLRQCLRESDVYNWYNKVPSTLSYTSLDATIIPENAKKTVDVQRGFYSWWDLSKYDIDSRDLGPFDHGLGALPYALASIDKFNNLRAGGYFNGWAVLTTKQGAENEAKINFSKIAPELVLKNVSSVKVKEYNTENIQKFDASEKVSLSSLKRGIYIIEVTNNQNQKQIIPFVKQDAIEVSEKELIKNASENSWTVNLTGLNNLVEINVFDVQNNKVKQVSLDEVSTNFVEVSSENLPEGNYTIELVTKNNSLKTNTLKRIITSENTLKVALKNNQLTIFGSAEIDRVELIDVSGRNILNKAVNSSNTVLDLSSKSGMYLLKVTYKNGKSEIKKIIK